MDVHRGMNAAEFKALAKGDRIQPAERCDYNTPGAWRVTRVTADGRVCITSEITGKRSHAINAARWIIAPPAP